MEFILSDKPVEMLGLYNKLHITGRQAIPGPTEGEEDKDEEEDSGAWKASLVASHPASNQEIQALAEDLQVLGRKEYKQLLKWRLSVRKDLLAEMAKRRAAAGEEEEGEEEEGEEEGEEEDPEQEILAEMEAIKVCVPLPPLSSPTADPASQLKTRLLPLLSGSSLPHPNGFTVLLPS